MQTTSAATTPATVAEPVPLPEPVSEPVQRRLIATLFSAQSVYNAAQVVSFSLMPLAAVALTGSEASAGLPATVLLIGRALVAYPIGWLMDRVGRRLTIALGFLLSVVGTGLSALALINGSFGLLILSSLINGFGRGTGEQTRYAAADIVAPERAANAISTLVFAGTVGAVLGPLLIAPSERFAAGLSIPALSGPYVISSSLSFVAFAIIYVFLRPDPGLISRRRDALLEQPSEGGRTIRQIFADPTVQLAVLSLGISQLVMTMIMVITPLHMQHEQHATESISWVIMAHTLGMFGLSGLTGRLTMRLGKPAMIVLGGLVLAISAILAPMAATVPMLALALFLLGLGWNFAYVAGSTLLAGAITSGERGRTQGTSETLIAVAAASASFGTGIAFEWGGLIAVGMISLALSMALIAALFWARRQPGGIGSERAPAQP